MISFFKKGGLRDQRKKNTNRLYLCPSSVEIKNMILVMNTNFYNPHIHLCTKFVQTGKLNGLSAYYIHFKTLKFIVYYLINRCVGRTSSLILF